MSLKVVSKIGSGSTSSNETGSVSEKKQQDLDPLPPLVDMQCLARRDAHFFFVNDPQNTESSGIAL